jgi:hypothetical protein
MLKSIPEVRDWLLENENHPKYKLVADELSAIEALERQLHKHNRENFQSLLAQMNPLEARILMLNGEVHFINSRQALPKTQEELISFMDEEFKKFHKEEVRKGREMVKAMGLNIEDPDYPGIDEDGNCGHDRELIQKMQPYYEAINLMLNGK